MRTRDKWKSEGDIMNSGLPLMKIVREIVKYRFDDHQTLRDAIRLSKEREEREND